MEGKYGASKEGSIVLAWGAGSPNRGELHQVMCWSRNKYHYAVRRAKRMAGTLKCRKLLEAAELGDQELMKEMKMTLGKKSQGQSVPEQLDGQVTHDTILNRFKECYEELYNSAGSEDAMTDIKEKLQKVIEDHPISAAGEF